MLRKTVIARALTIAFSTAALSTAVVAPAMAQSNAAGTVFGKVAAGAATSVVIRNTDTNQQRTVAVDAQGTFTATSLSPGHYRATLQGGSMNGRTSEVDVIAGQGSEFVFAGLTTERVVVTGRRTHIDVSSATNGATFTSRDLEKLPIPHNVDAIISLAPNTTHSDPTYVAGSSISGGAPSENAYYINGFPVTNPLTQLGASTLPYGAIATAEVKTGGYGAEFGRSVGGVVNITGKSGTNTWEAGAAISEMPASWRSKQKDLWYPVIGGKPTDGTLLWNKHQNDIKQKDMSFYVGGPIVQDKLFMFLSAQEIDTDRGYSNASRTASSNSKSGWTKEADRTLRYYTKFDWNITDNHRLEFTSIGDQARETLDLYGYNHLTGAIGTTRASSTFYQDNPNDGSNGAEDQFLRYTGNLTDNLTINAVYGKAKSKHIYEPAGYDPNMASVSSSDAVIPTDLRGSFASPQSFTGTVPLSGAMDKLTATRLDLEWKVGAHTLRGGLDQIKSESTDAGVVTAGGATWIYSNQELSAINQPVTVPGGTLPALSGTTGYGPQGYYVGKQIYSTASNLFGGQSAQYLEDKWQVTRNLVVTAGLRNEEFYNSNQLGQKFIDQKHSILPRLSATWDVNGDATFKVFGSAGRYSVPIPTSVTLRAANGSLYTTDYYTYTGIDKNGIPTGQAKIGGPFSADNEFGAPKDAKTVAVQNIKPSAQDELTVGFEKAYSPDMNFGAKATYRTLKSTIDDWCDQRPLDAYAAAHNIDESNYAGFTCALFNPGEATSLYVDYSGKGQYTLVNLTAAQMGFEKAKRVYEAVDVFFEHPYRNGWYAKVNYTLSRAKGNTEGQTNSDLNTGQGDVATTITWDYPELMYGANGLLPTDRTHQIKAYGFYDLAPEWTVGGFVNIESGRPKGCLGESPNPNGSPDYGVEHYCFGASSAQNVLAPRGTFGRLPWEKTVDMNLVYHPTAVKGLQLRLDVFNLFNEQVVAKNYEQYNAGNARSSLYGAVRTYTSPRSIKIGAEFNHRF